MILSGPAIHAAQLAGDIRISPFTPGQLNPASYDLTLGDELCVYVRPGVDRRHEGQCFGSARSLPDAPYQLDSRTDNPAYRARMDAERGFLVGGYEASRTLLLHTRETVYARRHAWVVDGKSSLGRLGLAIHVTAGYGDPGFEGQVTLEVVALGEPVRIYPGMRIAQVRFMPVVDEYGRNEQVPDYRERGHYTGAAARGPIPSRSHLQFEDHPTVPASVSATPPPEIAVNGCLTPGCPDPGSFNEKRGAGVCGGCGQILL